MHIALVIVAILVVVAMVFVDYRYESHGHELAMGTYSVYLSDHGYLCLYHELPMGAVPMRDAVACDGEPWREILWSYHFGATPQPPAP